MKPIQKLEFDLHVERFMLHFVLIRIGRIVLSISPKKVGNGGYLGVAQAVRFRVALLLAFGFSISASPLSAQAAPETEWVYVDSIEIKGNKKTRRSIILREFDFKTGDTLSFAELPDRLERNRLRVLNLGLFTDASLEVQRWKSGDLLVLRLTVKEGWYTYPVPVFELADRNFNVWWHEFNRSLKRVNYGVNWFQLNLTGRGDILRLNANFGYTNLYEATYTSPSINKRQTIGFQAGLRFSRRHEINYKTLNNKLEFRTDPETWQIQRWNANVGISFRPDFYVNHGLTLEFHKNTIADSIRLELNPDFFLNGAAEQRHFSFIYSFINDHRNIRPYPTKGWRMLGEFRWNGLLPGDDLHLGRLRGEYSHFFTCTEQLSLAVAVAGRFSFPRKQIPYFNNQGLGYGSQYVRGYEYFVADGLDYALLRTAFHFELFDHYLNLGKLMPLKNYRKVPLKAYLAFNNDTGYANDPFYGEGNPMSNRVLYGYGLGLDFVILYGNTLKLEWTRNDLGLQGFYLNVTSGF